MSDAAGAVDGVLRSAAARAVNGNTAAAVARDDGSWWAVLPDVLLLELAANGTSLTGGESWPGTVHHSQAVRCSSVATAGRCGCCRSVSDCR